MKDFVRGLLLAEGSQKLTALVDVWCEAPMIASWRETVDSLAELKEEGLSYHFAVGAWGVDGVR